MNASRVWRAWGCTVRLVVQDERIAPAAAERLAQILDRVDVAASRFRADSQLCRVNANAGRPVAVSRDLLDLLLAALAAAEQTEGTLDPLIGSHLRTCGYDRDFADVLPSGPDIGPMSPGATWREVNVDRSAGLVRVPAGTSLDLGATAKAQTADYAARELHQRFGGAVLVELGGDLAVAGERALGWSIRVAEREGGPGQLVTLHHGGLATSTTTLRQWNRGDRTVHHIIDPRTGAPAQGCWRTVSVAAASALSANTASTASIVLGAQALGWLQAHELAARLVHRDGHIVTTGDWPEPAADHPAFHAAAVPA